MKLGTAVHAELESYLKTGSEVGPIAAAGLKHLPKPNPSAFVEMGFRVYGMAMPFSGIVDLICGLGSKVMDHKTTSDFKWCQAEQSLRYNPQAVGYSRVAGPLIEAIKAGVEPEPEMYRGTEVYPLHLDQLGFRPVEFVLVYYRTKGAPDSCVVGRMMTVSDLELGWEQLAKEVSEMTELAAGPIENVPLKRANCGRYGRCPHRGDCHIDPRIVERWWE